MQTRKRTSQATEVFKAFEATLHRQDRSAITIRGYLSDLHDYIQWVEGAYGERFDAAHITQDDVRAYRSHLQTSRKAKPATINRKLATLSTFCRWAIGSGLLKVDPTNEVKRARQVKSPPKALDRTELNRLLRKVRQSDHPLHVAVIVTLANTGLRVSELCMLGMNDVHLKSRSGTVIVRDGKGNKYREVPLNTDARNALKAYLDVRPEATSKDARLFVGQRGALTTSGVWRIVEKYAQRAGIEGVSPHVLRHTFATRLLRGREPVDPVVVADLLGHESLDTTMLYTKSNEVDRRRAVELLSGLVE